LNFGSGFYQEPAVGICNPPRCTGCTTVVEGQTKGGEKGKKKGERKGGRIVIQ